MKLKPITAAVITVLLAGCGGGSSSSSPSEPADPNHPTDPTETIAPHSIAKYQSILDNSDLQVSDPDGSEGNKTSEVKNGAFDDYQSDYFYAEEDTSYLVFKMSNYKMRSEVRELENFDVSENGVKRTFYAEVKLPEIDLAMANSPADHDEVTFLQIHNKGTSSDGTGYIPHPLVRIVWEQERNGLTGHYWAVLKNNALDCSSDANAEGCSDSYTRYDLGEADLDDFTRFEISIFENTLSIEVNDESKANIDISYWSHLLSYFKAGIYNQFENGEGEAKFSQLTYEKENIDTSAKWNIDDWKITIPPSKDDWYGSGGTSAAELEPERCNSSKDVLSNSSNIYDNNIDISYFNVADGQMHFRADMGYGTSTANSNYIRSELRELYVSTDNPDCSTSDEDTSWYLNDLRTNAKSHTLEAQLQINEYPDLDFSEQRPKVVLGQIHGWKISQALVKLLWEGNDRPVRVILNDSFERNNQDCASCEPFSVTLGQYAANEEWRYIIRATQDGLFLATTDTDGSNLVSHQIGWGANYTDMNGDTVTLSSDWASDDIAFYFKAGIYPQFKPDDKYQGEIFDVSFNEVSTEHVQ